MIEQFDTEFFEKEIEYFQNKDKLDNQQNVARNTTVKPDENQFLNKATATISSANVQLLYSDKYLTGPQTVLPIEAHEQSNG